jgi:hypothetical protein
MIARRRWFSPPRLAYVDKTNAKVQRPAGSAAASRSVKVGHWERPRRRGLSIRAFRKRHHTPDGLSWSLSLGRFFLGLVTDRSGPLSRARAPWGQVKGAAPGYSARAAVRATPPSLTRLVALVWIRIAQSPEDQRSGQGQQGFKEKTRRREPAGHLLRSIFRPTNTRRRGCTKGGDSNSPFALEPRSSTLDPQMPPMLGFRCKRDKMQKTTFRQGVQRNHAFFCQCDQMSCKRGPSDARGNCTNPTRTVIAFPCPVKSPGKQLKFVIRSL